MVICLERGADLHMAQLMPLPLTVSCYSKIQIGFTFLVPAHPGSPGQRAVKCECVCVLVKITQWKVYLLLDLNWLLICTHTRLTALCPGLPGWAGTRKAKPIWILQTLDMHYLIKHTNIMVTPFSNTVHRKYQGTRSKFMVWWQHDKTGHKTFANNQIIIK